MENESSSLASKCLDLCQTLASQGQAFTFSLTIGSTFNFSMTTDSQDSPAPAAQGEKRKSPSTRRRDARRRKEFLRKKSQLPSSASQPVKDSTDVTLAGLDANSVEVMRKMQFLWIVHVLSAKSTLFLHTKSKLPGISSLEKWPMIIWILEHWSDPFCIVISMWTVWLL